MKSKPELWSWSAKQAVAILAVHNMELSDAGCDVLKRIEDGMITHEAFKEEILSRARAKADAVGEETNSHDGLDLMKLRISREVLSMFTVGEIKHRSRENIARWRVQGTSGAAYDDWAVILEDPDDSKMIAAMVGLSERSNQLRQSMPYVGLLDKTVVDEIKNQPPENK